MKIESELIKNIIEQSARELLFDENVMLSFTTNFYKKLEENYLTKKDVNLQFEEEIITNKLCGSVFFKKNNENPKITELQFSIGPEQASLEDII